jgi:hypothetical protein
MNKEQALKEWQYGTQTPTQPCNDYAPDTLAPEPADRETCTTCYHHKNDHMKTPDIITRLNAAACMLREHEQYNDDPDCNGEGLAADACDDAAALIKGLVKTIEYAIGDLNELFEHDAGTEDQLIGTYTMLNEAIAAATGAKA